MANFPVTMTGAKATVPGKINGTPANFIIDSGSFYGLIPPSSAAEFGLAASQMYGIVSQGANGQVNMSTTTVKNLVIAGIQLSNIPFLIGGSDVVPDQSVVIGQNILGIEDADYDLARGFVKLIKPQDCDDSDLAYWVTSQPYSVIDMHHLDWINKQTYTDVVVNGMSMRAMFDTGSPWSDLSLRAARRAGIDINGPGVVEGGYVGGIGQKLVKSWIAPVADFKIGGEEIRNTHLRIKEKGDENADIIIGVDFFLSHHVYVSNKQRKVYFTYNGGAVFNLEPAAASVAGAGTGVAETIDADGLARRGAALAAHREFQQAIAYLTKAIAMAPAEQSYVLQRALAYMRSDQPVLARADLDQALRLKPNDVQTLIMSAELRLAGQEKSAAIAELDRASRIAPPESIARLGIAHLYEEADLPASAIPQFDVWISYHRDDYRMGEALNGRCWARALSGQDLDSAVDDCNAALRRVPKEPNFLNSRALVFLRRGQFDRSIADNDAALAQKPKMASSLYIRGIAKLQKGMVADGKADMAAGVALQPELPDWAKSHGFAP